MPEEKLLAKVGNLYLQKTRDWSLEKTVWLNPPSREDEEQVKLAE